MISKKITLEGDQKVWFTSDSHYNHKNICRGTTQWDLSLEGGHESTRNFDTIGQMNAALVKGINSVVKPNDWIVHLGDWSFGGIDSIYDFYSQIMPETNIVLILGNHDHHIANNRVLPNAPEGTRAQDLFDTVASYLELTVVSNRGGKLNRKTTYNLMHFPIAIWNKAHHDRIMLHGHCHAGYQHPGRSLDVGVDMAYKLYGEYRPFSEDDIRRFMKGREFVKKDHHDRHTN